MLYPIDKGLFAELAQLNPQEVCRRADCTYETAEEAYVLSAWGDIYKIFPTRREIACLRGKGPGPHSYFSIFLIHHLLGAQPADSVREWISEKDIPGGATFFRGPHLIPTQLIAERYGNDTETFKKRCEGLGGAALSLADTAFSFQITSRTPVAVLYWRGDDDFAPEAKILFDRALAGYLAADAVFALAVDICSRLSAD
jgi:Domain of unknown function (DUF3786)